MYCHGCLQPSVPDCCPPNWSAQLCFQGWGEVILMSFQHSSWPGDPPATCEWPCLSLCMLSLMFQAIVIISQSTAFFFLCGGHVTRRPLPYAGHRSLVHRSDVWSLFWLVLQYIHTDASSGHMCNSIHHCRRRSHLFFDHIKVLSILAISQQLPTRYCLWRSLGWCFLLT